MSVRIRWLADVVVRIPWKDETIVLGRGIEATVPETEYFQNAIASGYAEELSDVGANSHSPVPVVNEKEVVSGD